MGIEEQGSARGFEEAPQTIFTVKKVAMIASICRAPR